MSISMNIRQVGTELLNADLLPNSTNCLYTLELCVCTSDSSIFTVPLGFHKLATCISWAALNGNNGGQHRQVPLFIQKINTELKSCRPS
jgi:hypothetical protein